MALWKNGAFAEDNFRLVPDEAALADGEPSIVTLARFRAERDQLLGRNTPIGLLIPPGADWSDIVGDLSRFSVIALDLPKFADGRAFSIGRLLRDRDGFTGELRAVGAFFLDQMPFLKRVGFDAFSTSDPLVLKGLEEGRWPEVTEYYQPASDIGEVPAGKRPWARRPAPKAAE
ncbi:DUF934 domain-containing protein [Kaistia dalseonensis]|uniref:Phosphoadenosine phosphosulfate reductase n=1 Tax=Kaistia dalseonensis TaxID=410840 RepID=A0ABU0HAM8_9HYPH|nr:DUF934 domain-containing protein [Kaistia dalseonensis]MCX5495918.1 DUF934 domain-containing protein [Kaistia dalseonensis]MDQ0438521.1 phosphoadenosine phosphosulfate reductase [Kaistia dalseonensis]